MEQQFLTEDIKTHLKNLFGIDKQKDESKNEEDKLQDYFNEQPEAHDVLGHVYRSIVSKPNHTKVRLAVFLPLNNFVKYNIQNVAEFADMVIKQDVLEFEENKNAQVNHDRNLTVIRQYDAQQFEPRKVYINNINHLMQDPTHLGIGIWDMPSSNRMTKTLLKSSPEKFKEKLIEALQYRNFVAVFKYSNFVNFYKQQEKNNLINASGEFTDENNQDTVLQFFNPKSFIVKYHNKNLFYNAQEQYENIISYKKKKEEEARKLREQEAKNTDSKDNNKASPDDVIKQKAEELKSKDDTKQSSNKGVTAEDNLIIPELKEDKKWLQSVYEYIIENFSKPVKTEYSSRELEDFYNHIEKSFKDAKDPDKNKITDLVVLYNIFKSKSQDLPYTADVTKNVIKLLAETLKTKLGLDVSEKKKEDGAKQATPEQPKQEETKK